MALTDQGTRMTLSQVYSLLPPVLTPPAAAVYCAPWRGWRERATARAVLLDLLPCSGLACSLTQLRMHYFGSLRAVSAVARVIAQTYRSTRWPSNAS